MRNKSRREGRKKMKLDGFGILVEDMAVMIRFYRDVLGFEIKEDENALNYFFCTEERILRK